MSASAEAAPVAIVGAGPGDPELLTLRAQRLIAAADVAIHDRLVAEPILAHARRGARRIAVGKVPYGEGWSQEAINALIVAEARRGGRIVRLKGGDPVVFGRLDDEIGALEAAGIAYEIVPGITAASAAAAAIGQSLTRRGRNGSVRLLTGHDVNGFAEQDWRALAGPGATAAIYMGVKAATFLRGRLLMHGARGDVAVTAVENASRPGERVIATTLMDLPAALAAAAPGGPVLILLGLAPRQAAAALPRLREAL
jgi:uroporphyrin-III C-methyltransferase